MRKRIAILTVSMALILLIVGIALATSNGFSIPWWTVDGGGGTSEGGDYTISGTIGQPDTSPLMSGGDFTVVGGFWGGEMTPPSPNLVYLPLVIR